MEEILVEPPQKMEVRIKILFTSICQTDLTAWKGEVVEGARTRGASKIIGIDINPNKLLKGQITDFSNPKDLGEPVHEKIREMTKGGVDYSFECAGNLEVLREALLSTHDGWGLTVVLGIILPRGCSLSIQWNCLTAGESPDQYLETSKGKTQLPHFAEECMRQEVKLDEFITHELPFREINEAFQLLVDGKSLRCLLHL